MPDDVNQRDPCLFIYSTWGYPMHAKENHFAFLMTTENGDYLKEEFHLNTPADIMASHCNFDPALL